ncbi:MAG: hypothetical protein HC919_12805 [Oscillatoriales cyanobacterium SM2_2_1]|nr:hypothetical protein [Oscillatoriales cyanobacterium SM2_2_1]
MLFSIPFWIIGLGIAYWAAQGVFGATTLYIDAHRFRLTHRLFQYQRCASGATRDLTGVQIHDTGAKINEQKIFALRLFHGVQHYDFGGFLTAIEKEWLAHEILAFIEVLKP